MWDFVGVYSDEALTGTKGFKSRVSTTYLKIVEQERLIWSLPNPSQDLQKHSHPLLETVRELKAIQR